MAKALNEPPGDVLDRAKHGDPQILFALAAESEAQDRDQQRWQNLYELLSDHGEAIVETIANAHSR